MSDNVSGNIAFRRGHLSNGLTVLVHSDAYTPLASVVVLYRVGACHEDPAKTGLAHLCEHLMFSGSRHVPDFDGVLQRVGGENNAYTNRDTTLYYEQLPVRSLETAFWAESDRMAWLSISEKAFRVQQSVVIEEFKESYLNRPYGDLSHLMVGTAYRLDPYRWPTIGLDVETIAAFEREDAVDFYARFYHPGNAILSVTGDVTFDEVMRQAERWFGDLEGRPAAVPPAVVDEGKERRFVEVTRPVVQDVTVFSYPMPGITQPDYEVYDTITDLLSGGESSRFDLELISQQMLFTELDAFVSSTSRCGQLQVVGMLSEGVSFDQADQAIAQEIEKLLTEVSDQELEKVHEKYCAELLYDGVSRFNRAETLALYEQLGDAALANQRIERRRAVTLDRVRSTVSTMLRDGAHRIRYRKEE